MVQKASIKKVLLSLAALTISSASLLFMAKAFSHKTAFL